MTQFDNELKDINELIKNYDDQLQQIQARITDQKDELGDTRSEGEAVEINRSINSLETKLRQIEDHRFGLVIKRTELRHFLADNSQKNRLTWISILISLVLSLIIIVLTYQQNDSNNELVALGAADIKITKNEMQGRFRALENICTPLLSDAEKQRVLGIRQEMKSLLRQFDERLQKIENQALPKGN